MASLDVSGRQRDALPSINHLDFDQYRLDKMDHKRFSMPGFSTIAKSAMSSPPIAYSGPPPPYSSTANSIHGISGYMSPPETSSRRSIRDEKESPKGNTSLPSISEALKSADMPSNSQPFTPRSVPGSAVCQTFADAPKGPGNPFSQPIAPASALRPSVSSVADPSPIKTVPPPPAPPDTRQPLLNVLDSPRPYAPGRRVSGSLFSSTSLEPPFRSSFPTDSPRPGYPFPDSQSTLSSLTSQPQNTSYFEQGSKFEETRDAFAKPESLPYTDTVKRHLDVYDAELALNEIAEASAHTLEFSKLWSQRHHQANRTNYQTDGLPGTADIDDMVRYSHHILESLSRLREVAVAQQTALNEQRARVARGQDCDDEIQRMSEDHKSGGFAGGDAKKRRGKAAPPGRCHSCNRAETPEWRRGPDGARTLCNACGLHYAKLTRKMGANKAGVVTGSNLRPKGMNDTL